MKQNGKTRLILNLDFEVPSKSAKVLAKRIARFEKISKRPKPGKMKFTVAGLIAHVNNIAKFTTKTGPNDKKTGEPKYIIARAQLRTPLLPKPVKAAKVEKAGRKTRRVRKSRGNSAAPAAAAAPENTMTVPPPAMPAGQVSSALATELADSSAPNSPAAAAPHATRRRRKDQVVTEAAAPAAPAAAVPAAPTPPPTGTPTPATSGTTGGTQS
jgi:hypothetical protein